MCDSAMPDSAEMPAMLRDPIPGVESMTGDSCLPAPLVPARPSSRPDTQSLHSPVCSSFAAMEDVQESSKVRFGEPDLPILSKMLGLRTVPTSEGGQIMYQFEQLTELDR